MTPWEREKNLNFIYQFFSELSSGTGRDASVLGTVGSEGRRMWFKAGGVLPGQTARGKRGSMPLLPKHHQARFSF